MIVSLDLSRDDRTPEQNEIVEKCKSAAKLLREHGSEAECELLIVSNPRNRPAHIVLRQP